MYDREKHRRRSIRLAGYDYGQVGAYFVTVCTANRAHLFGEVVAGEMRLNAGGMFVEECWLEIPEHFPNVELDAFVVMPKPCAWDHRHCRSGRGERFFAPTVAIEDDWVDGPWLQDRRD